MKNMRHEKSNKDGWTNRVDSLEATNLDKQASWQRLNERLLSEKKDKKYTWLWWPAAAAIVTGIIIWQNLDNKSEGVLPGAAQVTQINNKNGVEKKQVDSKIETPTAITQQKTIPATKQVSIPVNSLAIDSIKLNAPEASIAINKDSIKENMIVPVSATADLNKKKIKIVHNNELDAQPNAGAAPTPSIASSNPVGFWEMIKPGSPGNKNMELEYSEIKEKNGLLPFSGRSQKTQQ